MPQVEAPADETKTQDALDEKAQEDATGSEDNKDGDGSAADTSTDKSADGEGTDQGTDDKGASDDDSKTADDSAVKQQNRLGYQLRQIRTHDPYVAEIRRNLQDGYVNLEGLSDEQRAVRRLEANEYIKDVETKRAQLVADNAQVAGEFSIFNPSDAAFNKELYDRSLARFGRDSLERDDKGEITGYKISLLDYMREEADSYLAMVEAGKSKPAPTKKAPATTDAERAKMDAASDAPGGTSPAKGESQEDPTVKAFLAGFDSVK